MARPRAVVPFVLAVVYTAHQVVAMRIKLGESVVQHWLGVALAHMLWGPPGTRDGHRGQVMGPFVRMPGATCCGRDRTYLLQPTTAFRNALSARQAKTKFGSGRAEPQMTDASSSHSSGHPDPFPGTVSSDSHVAPHILLLTVFSGVSPCSPSAST